jgi:hypothetical protein
MELRRSSRIAKIKQPAQETTQQPTEICPCGQPATTQTKSVKEWLRSSTTPIDREAIDKERTTLRNYLTTLQSLESNPTQKIEQMISLFEYLMTHTRLISTNPYFRNVVKEKLIEFKYDIQYSNVSQYLQEKFLLACKYLEKTLESI